MNEFIVTIKNYKNKVSLNNGNQVTINEKTYDFELVQLINNKFSLRIGDSFFEVTGLHSNSNNFSVLVNGKSFDTLVLSELQEKARKLLEQKSKASFGTEIKAPMPGMLLKIKKNKGEEVQQGESVMILEAMKMENDLRSPVSGKIKDIYIKEGAPVEKGAKLFSIE